MRIGLWAVNYPTDQPSRSAKHGKFIAGLQNLLHNRGKLALYQRKSASSRPLAMLSKRA